MEPVSARRAIKRLRKICNRRLRRNFTVSILVVVPPLLVGLIILWGDNRFVPYVWSGARSILMALWIVSLVAGAATWFGMLLSTFEQYRVLARLKQQESQLDSSEGVSA